jgi:predicted nucleotidyltransferase
MINDTYPPEIEIQLNSSIESLKMILGSDLVGIYLFGSSVLGGLQKYSDLDLCVVTHRPTTIDEKRKLIFNLVEISGIYMKSSKRPIEMTLVEENMIKPWRYPPIFDFQYGEWLRESFEVGIIEPALGGEMQDLAIIVTQVLLRSKTLWGPDPKEVFDCVPYCDFINAMLSDLDRLSENLESDTRNVLLTLARIWSTLETNSIYSKPAAADWAIASLPELFTPVLKRAKSICIGSEPEKWEDMTLLTKSCADIITSKINELYASLDLKNPQNVITLSAESF